MTDEYDVTSEKICPSKDFPELRDITAEDPNPNSGPVKPAPFVGCHFSIIEAHLVIIRHIYIGKDNGKNS